MLKSWECIIYVLVALLDFIVLLSFMYILIHLKNFYIFIILCYAGCCFAYKIYRLLKIIKRWPVG